MERITELNLIKEVDRTEADVAEIYILRHTAELKRDFEIAETNLQSAEGFVRAEQAKVAKLRDEVIPQLVKEYNDAIAKSRGVSVLQKKRSDAQKELEFAEGWLKGKNIEKNPAFKPKYAPSEAEQTIETATTARNKAKNDYRNGMQRSFMTTMESLNKRADAAMANLFEAFEDKWRIIQRCGRILPGFIPPVPNPVQVKGFIATIYRDQAMKIRYQKMCSIFPRAVLAGKHEFERQIREARNEAEAKHNKEYNRNLQSCISNNVTVFKKNNPDADFNSEQMQAEIKDIEASAKSRYLAEHPQKPFVYNPPKYESEKVTDTDPVLYFQSIEDNVANIAAETHRKAEADIKAGRALPQTRRKPNLVIKDSKDFAPSKKDRDIEREKKAIKAAKSAPTENDNFARGLSAADMM